MYPFLVGGQPNVVVSTEQDSLTRSGWTLDALVSKAARKERRMARQRSLSLSRNNANAAASSESSSPSSRRHAPFPWNEDDHRGSMSTSSSGAGADMQNINKHLYTFCTPDNKKLRVMFKKELKNSDVGSLGRIVLPKKEAEENLPMLSDKEGIQLMIRDVYSDQEWGLKYKYWSNNKSRMYLLENTGDFVKQNKLEVGDCICLLEDEDKNLYISTETRAGSIHAKPPSHINNNNNNNTTNHKANNSNSNTTTEGNTPDSNLNYADANTNTNAKSYSNNHNATADIPTPSAYTYVARDEEDASSSSLALLVQQLQKEKEANTIIALSMTCASSPHIQCEEANDATGHVKTSMQPSTLAGFEPAPSPSPSQRRAMTRMANDDQFETDDCYKGLGTLPEVDRYKYCDDFCLFDYNGSITTDDDKS